MVAISIIVIMAMIITIVIVTLILRVASINYFLNVFSSFKSLFSSVKKFSFCSNDVCMWF